MRDDRSVTPPPIRPPSPTYLSLAAQAPLRIGEPSASKKLLVLDLNGTLLHRSPHNPRPKTRHQQPQEDRPRDEQGNWLPRLRPVHPRPYMRAFRSYLFAPQTSAWLDVMVWSSAQPHSVGDMVDRCFGEEKEKLLVIWARDTLGLSSDHYHRKVQTVKDLAKPWAFLSQKSAHIPSSPHSSIASTPRTSPEPSSPTRPSDDSIPMTPQSHSALTTLLLDDSPRKAELQPYNHVCIGEYSGERRAKDLESLQKEQEWQTAVDARQQLDAQMAHLSHPLLPDSPEALAPKDDAEPIPDGDGLEEGASAAAETSKKRKRKEKKLQKRAALLEQLEVGGKPQGSYDETLLAVIGVLDEIKSQANVAAWIRAGGLWGPVGPPEARSANVQARVEKHDNKLALAGQRTSESTPAAEEAAAQSDGSDLSVKNAPTTASAVQPADEETDKPRKRKKKRQRMRDSTGDQEAQPAEVVDVGNDEETAAPVSSSPAHSTDIEKTVERPQVMWFEDEQVLNHWATRGRKALDELGIPVEHGIER
ncbi:hypothetical protein TRAPUB_1912 [Trametes pubescens]|uniref:Mitochondrial import inner membrane translocase subunit TIM50 n=1 Tax=Trametes pubescens TaxID=154538 RepID=A0A1M2VI10_TRAPU|nr:hypothetical protein TRAPUB_1912 [Trametes pubescens]